MIFNMHVRNDYRLWYDTGGVRIKTLCGVKTQSKFTGVPGVTKQFVGVLDGDYGWCLTCCNLAVQQMTGIFTSNQLVEPLRTLYLEAIMVLTEQLMVALTPDKS